MFRVFINRKILYFNPKPELLLVLIDIGVKIIKLRVIKKNINIKKIDNNKNNLLNTLSPVGILYFNKLGNRAVNIYKFIYKINKIVGNKFVFEFF